MMKISEKRWFTVWARGLNCHQQIIPDTAGDPECVSHTWQRVFASSQCPQHLSICWHSFHFICKGEYTCRGFGQSLSRSPPGKEIRALAGGGDKLLALTDTGLFLLDPSSTDHWRSISLQSCVFLPPGVASDQCLSSADSNSNSLTVSGQSSQNLCQVAVGAHVLAACCHDGSVRGLQPILMEEESCESSGGSPRIVEVSCGRQHVLMLTSAGSVLSLYGNSRGQLGLGDLDDRESARHVTALHGINIIEIAAGSWHSLALSRDGDVYAWGWNESGQLGCDLAEVTVSAEPRLVDAWPLELCMSRISCGARHSLALSSDGRIFGWGNNEFHQLTLSRHHMIIPPSALSLPDSVASHGHVTSLVAGEGTSLIVCSEPFTDRSSENCD